ncbi:DUF4287 domain-containing protein [Rhodococcus sp. IEGM 1406]|uniref:DUF5655 domain-containing protein n=1 Tax=Rhodococcus sp. IEGM 1406 TaxID=3047083 RepID=UPI0032D580A4
MAAVTSSMRDRTGRTLEEWVEAVRTSGVDPLDQNEVRKWLKAEHGVPQNSQWAIAFETAKQSGWVEPTVEQYIDQQYSGPKVALRPIFDAARRLIEELGTDVRVEGRGTYTPFVRARQFAAISFSGGHRERSDPDRRLRRIRKTPQPQPIRPSGPLLVHRIHQHRLHPG